MAGGRLPLGTRSTALFTQRGTTNLVTHLDIHNRSHGWITRSARSRSGCAIVRPSALAVLRLIARSNLVDCSTGRSAGFAPFRILSTYVAARRAKSAALGP